jgi:hypothetical protein
MEFNPLALLTKAAQHISSLTNNDLNVDKVLLVKQPKLERRLSSEFDNLAGEGGN